ncbi:hypothetical protein CLOM_g7354 [Closterium sp. NIES-68]|nr:hypothetical protein CLOM_g7354 [Closterium sp. NIES-68]GJP71348.1 hypothetical protein CLOP_g2188 [Closterium sp. NIES-67]
MDALLLSSPAPRASLAAPSSRTSLRTTHAGRALLAAPRRLSLHGGAARSSRGGRAVRVVAEGGEAEMEKGRAAMRQWWQAQLAAKAGHQGEKAAGAVAVADGGNGQAGMDAARAQMRQWWAAQQAGKAERAGVEVSKAQMRGWWWLEQQQGKAMDAARAEMRAWWVAQQQGKAGAAAAAGMEEMEEMEGMEGMERGRAAMRAWWVQQQQGKAMDAARAQMREWWVQQQQGKALDAARAEMRAWWVAQQQGRAEAAAVAGMEQGRAAMRAWWLAQLAEKKAAAEAGRVEQLQAEQDESRSQLNEWAVGKWRAVLGEAEQQAEEAKLEAMEAGRAAMRQWWTNQLEEKAARLAEQAAAEVAAEAAMFAAAAADFGGGDVSDSEYIASDDEEQMDLVAGMVDLSDNERAVIERELRRERTKREAKKAVLERDVQRSMDRSRAAMRSWWLQQWGAKQRAMGWGDNPPVWRLKLTAGVADTPGGSSALADVEVAGNGVTLGLFPQPEDGSRPVELHLKGVSFAHCVVYGRDKFMGFGKYRREYFIKDAGSTTGTFVNGKLLGVNAPRKLANGDVIKLGPEVELLVTDPSL